MAKSSIKRPVAIPETDKMPPLLILNVLSDTKHEFGNRYDRNQTTLSISKTNNGAPVVGRKIFGNAKAANSGIIRPSKQRDSDMQKKETVRMSRRIFGLSPPNEIMNSKVVVYITRTRFRVQNCLLIMSSRRFPTLIENRSVQYKVTFAIRLAFSILRTKNNAL